MTRSKIENRLIASLSADIPDICVAACVFPRSSDGYPFHAALAVCIGAERSFFHFDAADITEEQFNGYWFVLKEFDTIPPFEANAFRVICRSALRNPPPRYHYLFDGSHYREGTFDARNGSLSYHMTCVGFCLAILKEWFDDDYIDFEDWTAENSLSPEKVEEQTRQLQALYANMTEDQLKANMRRIKPSEFVASAFSKKYPVRKQETDKIAPEIQNIVPEWFAASRAATT